LPTVIDWTAIKTEYITGQGSYRTLAEKYGLRKDRIARRGKSEGWERQRDATRDSIEEKTVHKAVEKISDKLSDGYGDQAATKARIKHKLLLMAENWIDAQDGQVHDAGEFRRIVQCCVDLLEAADMGAEQKLRVIMEEGTGDYAD
jgi:hypothetical protein